MIEHVDARSRRRPRESLPLASYTRSGEQDWQRAFDSMVDGIANISLDHRIMRANQTLARMMGERTPDEMVGQRVTKLSTACNQSWSTALWALVLQKDGRKSWKDRNLL